MNELTKQSLDSRNQQVVESHYLHTIYNNYAYVKNQFLEKVNLQLSKSIWNNIIRNQQAREDRFLAKLNIKATSSKDKMIKLNQWIQENELLREVIAVQNIYIDEVLQEALNTSLSFSGNENISEEETGSMINNVVKILSNNKQKEMNNIIKNFNNEIGNDFNSLEKNITNIIQKNLKKKNENLEELKSNILNSSEIQNLKGAILKEGLQNALNELLTNLIKDKNISSTEKIAAQRLKQSYDKKIEINADLTNKLLNLQRKNIGIPLRWGGKTDTIDNFIRNMSKYPKLQSATESYYEQRDSIIYQIVNNLLFTRYDTNKSNEIQQILKIVRQSILYMAMEEVNQETDSDFLFIENKIVPLSLLMERIRDYDTFKPTIAVNNTELQPYDKTILKEKRNSPIEGGEYYTGSLNIGSRNGELIWKSIRLKNLDLKLSLKI